jgi:anthranilate synthase component I
MTPTGARSTGAAQVSRDAVRAMAREHTMVPVWREILADVETPVSVFAKLVGDDDGFLLESVEHAERWGRFSFIGRDPQLTLLAHGNQITWRGTPPAGIPHDRGALVAIDALLAHFRSPRIAELPPFHGGLVGHLGYDIVREIERLPGCPGDDIGFPDAVMSVPRQVVAFDHFRQRLQLIENLHLPDGATEAMVDEAYDAASRRLDETVGAVGRPLRYQPAPPPAAVAADDLELLPTSGPWSSDGFRRAVEVAKEHILAGDIFQVVLAQRFDVELPSAPFEVYRSLRQLNPSPYMYFVRHPEITIVGSSPEPMVQLLDGKVISRPIAGTRRRGRTDDDDRRMAAELTEHPKERAEHVMLVDLARNDVGRVVRFGTETVEELMVLERYSHVMHLTSQVSGTLREGLGPVDVLRATFPAGTVSGAPKVRAMEIIDELEPVKRGPYAGVVGYLDFAGNLDTAIAIRTMFVRPPEAGNDARSRAAGSGAVDATAAVRWRASIQAGAGVVADSDPELEDLECHNKARALLSAAAAARGLTPLLVGEPSDA